MGKIRRFINRIQTIFGIDIEQQKLRNAFGLTDAEIKSWKGLPACTESIKSLKDSSLA